MIESAQNLQTLILALSIGGSAIGGFLVWVMLRDDAPEQPQPNLDDIIRTAPYDGLENVLKVAKS